LVFFVEVCGAGCAGAGVTTGLSGEIDFAVFCKMAGLSATTTDDVGIEVTDLRTVVSAMTNFAT